MSSASFPLRSRVPAYGLMILTAVVALGFVSYTQHAWEDYYITFRASKNLATGNGLVFTPGERVHSFTSPIGVLLPAFCSWVTGNHNDPAALWLYRLLCIGALMGAVGFVYRTVEAARGGRMAAVFGALVVMLEAKILDFSTNGMETAWWLLFVGWTLWALAANPPRRWLHLGAAWAGLMWSRPDSFIYIGLIGGAWLVFRFFSGSKTEGRAALMLLLRAATVCTVLYLPWFLWAWSYYGSPVPHTVTAKASVSDGKTVLGYLTAMVTLPYQLWLDKTSAVGPLMPTYYVGVTWPWFVTWPAKIFAFVAMLAWVWPRLNPVIRAASFAFLGGNSYLAYFPYFPFPWYFPILGFLGAVVWAGVFDQAIALAKRLPRPLRWAGLFLFLWLPLVQVGLTINAAIQMKAKQEIVYDGNLRRIGEWLRENARPTDRVFLEPLGYIGYFSQLPTDDYPGLSCPRMVEARKVANNWSGLLVHLGPEWAVLRPHEAELIEKENPQVLGGIYEPIQRFDVMAAADAAPVYDKFMLRFDADFSVYRRTKPRLPTERVTYVKPAFMDHPEPTALGNAMGWLIHAPGEMHLDVPAGFSAIEVGFGLRENSYTQAEKTDGATFEVVWVRGDRRESIMSVTLDPASVPEDRGLQLRRIGLPEVAREGDELHLFTHSGPSSAFDWTIWAGLQFE